MAATGLTTKATRAKSVWNMHQAWYAHTNPKTSEEDMQSHYSHHTLHYGAHKDEEEYLELWDDIHEYWKESYTIVNWPTAVPTVGPDFNIKGLSADELHALTVPFLKEQMGADFHSEVCVEDDGDDSLVPVPTASFDLREWTPKKKELFKMVSPEMFKILLLVNTFN
ncbi:hypothetical protein M404DRAFT_36000 [Pisolithus tinctorius Marx 270]|uniref:Uncharacterized protein n=1 Tax=Pisolithus tinctorius Marx 270 TaxID=870435 RepID=A0A0C3I8V2_PISTI|nr:hypothetical protein M404DRAFT_36000 [Pisolithus tinctorius Marx 270]